MHVVAILVKPEDSWSTRRFKWKGFKNCILTLNFVKKEKKNQISIQKTLIHNAKKKAVQASDIEQVIV